jgi:hypothetical protein
MLLRHVALELDEKCVTINSDVAVMPKISYFD